ncbi:MAG: response regulator [Rubrivivax sp.]|nr:response regulator [Rubrivivax sp.]
MTEPTGPSAPAASTPAAGDLRSDDARFRQFIEQAPLAIGISRGEVQLYGNPRFFEMFRVPDGQALGERLVSAMVAPASREWVAELSRRRAAGEPVPVSYEIQALRWDGTAFSCLVSLTEVLLADGPASLVFLQDMSDLADTRAAMQAERDRAERYLHVAQALLVAVDAEGRITLVNRKGHQLLGWDEGTLVGRFWHATCRPPEKLAESRGEFLEVMAGRRPLSEYHESEVLTRQGERRRIAWRNSPVFDAEGRLAGLLSSGEDITERRRAEDGLRELNASLERRVAQRTRELETSNAALAEARDAAEAATRAKGDFLAHMSHEIRTPMNAILGLTQLALRSEEISPRLRELLGHVHHAGKALLDILNGVLDFSKLESGSLQLESAPFSLDEALARLRALLGPSASDKGLAFRVEVGPEVPRRLVGDALRLGQVLLNLCSNAVKFTEAGEVSVWVAADGEQAGQVTLHFTVRDTGIGIAAAQLPRLFRPFDQLDASTSRRFGGTGLGLSICKQLVGLMGGVIGARSEPGRGSEFHFSLPFALAAAAAPGAVAQTGEPLPTAMDPLERLAGCRVLLVEDNELNQMVARGLLGDVGGAQVTMAADGAAALALLASHRFDIVLMDVQMPGMDGHETTRRLRRLPQCAGLPVIAMTAHALERDRELCREAGMDDFIGKPFDPAELFRIVSRWCTKASAPRAGEPVAAVDFRLGLHRCLGRHDLYARVLQRFVQTRTGDAAALRLALEAGERDAARLIAHSMASTAGAIGAEALAGHARLLEQWLQQGEPLVAARAAPFVDELAAVLQAIVEQQAEAAKA